MIPTRTGRPRVCVVAATLVGLLAGLSLTARAQVAEPVEDLAPPAEGSPRRELPPLPDDPRIDPVTGAAVAAWRPATWFDYQHIRLELDFPDLQKPFLTGRETIRAVAVGKPRSAMRLDAKKLEIQAARVGRKALRFENTGSHVTVHLPEPIEPGETVEVVFDYSVDFGYCKGQGLTWSAGKPDAESQTDRVPQIHSQGQAQDNSRWFICHDFPNEKMTTELIVTVENGFEVSSNGRLVSKESAGKGRSRWHWLQDKPHPAYLVTLVIGQFSIIELGGPDSARPGLSIPVYAPIGTEDRVRMLYKQTPAMIAFFETLFEEPFPWDRYAQLICRDFTWGGMENTGATTMTLGSIHGEEGSQDGLIAHELGHQWFGDLVTCKGWENLWLNEGWASYCEALWDEHAAGSDPADRRRAYQRAISRFLSGQRVRNTSSAPESPPLVSNRYLNESQVMGKPDDVYGKGALVLHMLRMRLGDEAFFRGVRAYLDRFAYRHATTDDFRRCLEDASGQSLDRFFTQWTQRPGMPRLDVSYDYDAASSELTIRVDQTQRIDVHNPAYAFSLPFYLRYPNSQPEYVYLDMDTRSATGKFTVPEQPSAITVDPRLTVFAPHRIAKELPSESAGEESTLDGQ